MNIFISGSNGFIAKHLSNHLKEHNLYKHTRKDFDLTDSFETLKFFSNKTFDVIIHTAVVGGSRLKPEDSSILDNNLKMYYNLLSHKNKYNKFINFGSGAETHASNTPYGLSKLTISESIKGKDNFYNIRIFGIFDKNEWDTRFIKTCIKKYINKEPMLVQDKKMSFFYMKDLITLVDYHIQTSPSSLLKESNCAYTNSTSLLDIANIINELDNYKVPIYVDTQVGKDYESNYNAPYGLKYIGLKQGIIETYNKLKNEY
jgi:GDP-L-fucose synthase